MDGNIIGGSATSLVGSFVLIDEAERKSAKVHRGRGMLQIVEPVSDHKVAKGPAVCSRHCSPPPTRSRSPSTRPPSQSTAGSARNSGSGRTSRRQSVSQPAPPIRNGRGSPLPPRISWTDLDEALPASPQQAARLAFSGHPGRSRYYDGHLAPHLPRPQVTSTAHSNTVVDAVVTAVRRASITVNPFKPPSAVDVPAASDHEQERHAAISIAPSFTTAAVCTPTVAQVHATAAYCGVSMTDTAAIRQLHGHLIGRTEDFST